MDDWNFFPNKHQEYISAEQLGGSMRGLPASLPCFLAGRFSVLPEGFTPFAGREAAQVSARAVVNSSGAFRGGKESPRSLTQAGLIQSNFTFQCLSVNLK